MVTPLIPMLVKIGLKQTSRGTVHAYPDFNAIESNLRGGLDWSSFVDRHGGWCYDKMAGHVDDDPTNDSPAGTWLGLIAVPADFAAACEAKFSGTCRLVPEALAKDFYENRVTVLQPAILDSLEVLQTLAAKKTLGLPFDADDNKALDPTNPCLGRCTNTLKMWAGFKMKLADPIDPAYSLATDPADPAETIAGSGGFRQWVRGLFGR